MPKVGRAIPVLMGGFPLTVLYIVGLVHAATTLLELLRSVLDDAPPGKAPPADAHCFAAAAWAAALLEPVATLLQRCEPAVNLTAVLLDSAAGLVKQLLIRLRSDGQPLERRLRNGPARQALLVGAVSELLAAALRVREQQGAQAVVVLLLLLPLLLTGRAHGLQQCAEVS